MIKDRDSRASARKIAQVRKQPIKQGLQEQVCPCAAVFREGVEKGAKHKSQHLRSAKVTLTH